MRRRVRPLGEAVPYSGWNGPVGEYDLGVGPPKQARTRRKQRYTRATTCAFCDSSTKRKYRLTRWRIVGDRRSAHSERLVDRPMCMMHHERIQAGRLLRQGEYAFGRLAAPTAASAHQASLERGAAA